MKEDFGTASGGTSRAVAATLQANPLLTAGFVAFLFAAAVVALFATIGTALAHHNDYSASANCAGDWTATANYVGGTSRRLLVISDVKVNGQAYQTTWSTDAGDGTPFGSSSIAAYSLGSGDFESGEAPGGTPDFMWDGTDDGWSIFNRSGVGDFINGAGDWGGTVYLYERIGSKWSIVDTDNITAPSGSTNCGTIKIKKVTTNGDTAQTFTADINGPGSTYDYNNVPFSQGSPASRVVQANGSDDYTVTEDSPPSGWTFLGKYLAAGDAACPAADSGSWTLTSDRQVSISNMPAGSTKTVCYLNGPTTGTIKIKKVLIGGDPNQTFTADLDQAGGSTYDENNIPFSVNSPASRTVLANGSEDYDVTEDVPPAGYTYVGKYYAVGDVTCPSSTNLPAWTIDANRTVTINNIPAGSTKTVCYLNQISTGTIIVCKDVVPNDASTWNFSLSGPTPGTTDGLGDGQCHTFTDRTSGQYTLNETTSPSYTTTVDCNTQFTNGGSSATFNLAAGGSVTCTFTNTKLGTITVCKDVVPNDSSTWNFSLSGPTPGTKNGLGDGQCYSFTDRNSGQYTLSETTSASYTTTVDCNTQFTNGGSSATFTLAVSGSVTCTFTNTKLGKITVCKDVVPNDDSEWHFTLGGDGDDSTDLQDGECHTFDNLPAGEYSLSEVLSPNYTTTFDCDTGFDDGPGIAYFKLVNGGHVTCNFTNTAKARITVCKDVVPNNATLWDFNLSGPTPGSVDDIADGHCYTFENRGSGQYVLSEATQAGYDESVNCGNEGSDNDANITLNVSAGDDITCTYYNKHAKITVCKQVLPENDDNTWTFTVSGISGVFQSDPLGNGQCDSFDPLEAGEYTVSEVVEPGYATHVVCTNDATGLVVTTFDLEIGQQVTCTFTNTRLGSITIIKQTLPDGSLQNFSFSGGTLGNPILGDGDSNTVSNLAAGDYATSENVPGGWQLTDIDCGLANVTEAGSGVTVHLGIGENVTCTFTNTEEGSITICKETDPEGSQQAFNFNGTAPIGNFNIGDGQCHTTSGLLPDTYNVSESVPAHWQLTDIQCGNADASKVYNNVSITLHVGEDVTCTFYDRELGTITICKQTDPDGSSQTFSFGGSFDGFTLQDGGCKTFSDLEPGGYSVEEFTPEGWDITDIDCGNADAGIGKAGLEVELHAGEDVTCTFTNTQRGSITVCKQTVPDGSAGEFPFSGDLGQFSLTDDECQQFGLLEPNTSYDVSELVPEGWLLTNIFCIGVDYGSIQNGVSVMLAPGEIGTCTFVDSAPGTVTVIKITDPASDTTTGFNFGGSFGPFTLTGNGDSQTFQDLEAGPYHVSEAETAGWALTTIDCGNAGANINGTQASFQLPAGGAVTCVFTNVEDASLTIIKQTMPDGNSQTFDFEGDIGNFNLGDGDSNTADGLAPGTYEVNEIVPAGWTLASVDCLGPVNHTVNGIVVVLAAGEDEVCTFTNELTPIETPTPTPTTEPTPPPTTEPTPPPTGVPTPPPTGVPTPTPTGEPTPPPTDVPTPPPTDVPTPPPTDVPTPPPTDVPTPPPTEVPTPVPTEVPTPVPTEVPTPVPTAEAATQTPVVAPAVFPPTGGSTGAGDSALSLLLLLGGAAFILGTILIARATRRQDR